MTEQEFNEFIEEQKKSGKSEEEIIKVFCLMFKEGKLDREQLEAVIEALGYELTDEFKGYDDEELKEKLIVEEKEEGEERKIDPNAPLPPSAEDKPEEKEEAEVKEESETKEESESKGGDEDEEERKKAMKMFGLEK